MRVAVIHSFYGSAQPSGENSVVDEQVRTLRECGHTVQLLARRTDDLASRPGYQMGAALTAASGWGPTPSNRLEAFDPDVIHLHNVFPNFGTQWVRKWGHRTVATLHNYRSVCAAGTLFRDGKECHDCLQKPVLPAIRNKCYKNSSVRTAPLAIAASPFGSIRRVLNNVAHIVALNSQMASTIAPFTTTPIAEVNNFVSHAGALSPTARNWAFVGRLTAEKGIGEILARWDQSRHLHVFGDGPLREQLADRYFGEPWVTWHGNVPRQEVLDVLPTMEGLVVPSLWTEGLPTVVLEALARAVPVALGPAMSAAEHLVQRGAAVLVEPRSASSVSRALAEVAERGQTMRTAATELHRSTYSPEAWLDQIIPVYRLVVARSRR